MYLPVHSRFQDTPVLVIISGSWIFRGYRLLLDCVPFFPILFKLFLKQVAVCVSPGERSFEELCCSSSMYKGPVGLTLDSDPFRLGLRLRSDQ